MKWSRTRPARQGWYWRRLTRLDERGVFESGFEDVVRVRFEEQFVGFGEQRLYVVEGDESFDLDTYESTCSHVWEWCGPLESPEEDEVKWT